ncbi:bifunctional diaminohydroxyphosphoribosylaminopyrimidine deaminase/5-amino-6-(5-phosphoribosylamino)uracil reductase RibD [Rhodomicrobium vannielii ATCC 17100]|uniref:bifunctional diaminohydroxyphosphoribosylaminopyrimidine deaminase/5-amino-6-(5-phosphoribosylamino)uracil reductase RibD n=1 Tax=Rhodomicrobium vannielii TaxID=1069 RepID=UPI001917EF8F|nr:bifunctional diaminohydroxyphosphoribosylaminopyrimidine deaminase/5-amino-6-(5-phosphoribosylamino)uracil reductase RibD [Rhodomicrobium vannielii]MBJ7533196.1 bifunctional diaminohydroxyphosphoribosylaminopyrimidine deaminase/5-amino-6-(5-phosphoribosylamino)uracil reductase RibD [Rhodomicrobium vannielii ATCC 17100]
MNEPAATSLNATPTTTPDDAAPLPLPSPVIDALCRRALFVAQTNIGATSPNPSVGAVVADARTGEIIASAATARGGRPHAEVLALREAGDRAKGALIITTLEPCSHFGATPPCSHAIVKAGISHLIYGSLDPDTRVAGRGLTYVAQHGVRATRGTPAFVRDCDWLHLGHSLRVTERRPFVQVKLAVDAAGFVPLGTGKPVFITGDVARAAAHLLRARADAILVGRKTVEADDPELTCRLPGLADRSPVRVVLASRCNVPPAAKLFANERPPVWIVCGDSTEGTAFFGRPGVRVLDIGASLTGRLNLRLAMMRVAAEGITRLLVEGGPSTARGFIDAGLADEVIIMRGAQTLDPQAGMPPFGDRGLDLVAASPQFTLFDKRKAGADTISIYRSTAHWQN